MVLSPREATGEGLPVREEVMISVAIGTMRAAADRGLRVPEDLSVIGFDGIEYTHYSVPRIATVRQDTDALAKRSVEDLLLRINYSRPSVHEVIPFRVIAGESVAKIRENSEKGID